MLTDSVVMSLYFETPLHAPSGSVLGNVEHPVQRERTTQWPVVYASTLHSALRASVAEMHGESKADEVFGKVGEQGPLSIGDARILLFPVRSTVAPFVWVTCPAVIARVRRDLQRSTGVEIAPPPAVKTDEIVTSAGWGQSEATVVAEDIVLSARKGYDATGLISMLPADGSAYDGFAKMVESCFGVVSDEVFGFLVRTATEVRVVGGMLGDSAQPTYDESIPADSVFYVPIAALGTSEAQRQALDNFANSVSSHLRVGGGEYVGRGWARTRLLKAQG